jgi:hypothetical protein
MYAQENPISSRMLMLSSSSGAVHSAEDLVLFMKLSLVKRGSLRSLYTTWWVFPVKSLT